MDWEWWQETGNEKITKTWAKSEVKSNEPLVEEVATFRMGMMMAREAHWKAVEIQSDCKSWRKMSRNPR